MDRRMRVAVGGTRHETNSFSPVPTTIDDFEVRRGDAIADPAVTEAEGADQAEIIPLFVASTLPGGTVSEDSYEHLAGKLLAEIREALPLDGLFLDLHGAMEVEGVGDGESDLIRRIRDVIGREPIVSVGLDLHGNISPDLVEQSDTLTALRTAPHRDSFETRRRAMTNLVRALRTGMRPKAALVKVPMLMPGERAMTGVEPARSLYARLPELERMPGILDASILAGCAWTDSPYAIASVIVVAESDPDLAETEAIRIAQDVWDKRREFTFGQETAPLDVAVSAAIASPVRPVYITDSGDNVTAGAPGDLPLAVEGLLELGAKNALVAGLVDPESVAASAAAGEGAEVELQVGGKLDASLGGPITINATVLGLIPDSDGQISMASIRCRGVSVVLTRDRHVFLDRASIREAGFEPAEQQIVVVKLGYLFPDLSDHAARAIMALTPGASDLRIERLPYKNVLRPVYPLDREFAWAPQGRAEPSG